MVKIRKIELRDLEEYVELSKQLGYEADIDHVKKCITHATPTEIVYVAQKNERIIGWIDARISHSYLSKDYGEIVGFIVDEQERNHGIGKSLLREVELWIKNKSIEKYGYIQMLKEKMHIYFIRIMVINILKNRKY